MTNERRGLDLLLSHYDDYDVVRIEQNDWWLLVDLRESFPSDVYHIDTTTGAATEVGTLPFAIWRHTGDVYRVGLDGAVEDDAFLEVQRNLGQVTTLVDDFQLWALKQEIDLDDLTTRESRDLVTRWIASTRPTGD